MNNSLRNQTEIHALRHEESPGFFEGADTNEGTSMPIKDADTTLGMFVLLIACLVLAALAHVIV